MEVDTRLHNLEEFNIAVENTEDLKPPLSQTDDPSFISLTTVTQDVLSKTLKAYNQPSDTSPSSSSISSEANSPSAPFLPPCRICGEKASGFHYGANTCEACKGFFRRSLARKEMYKCTGTQGEGHCDIGVGKRNVCGYCRYQKCLAVGMSKSAIKTGRYTHKKKTQDIKEVKRLQHQEKLKKEGKIVLETESQELELEKIIQHITSVHMLQTPHTPEFFEKLPQKEKEFLEQRELQQKMFGTMRPLPREEYMKIYQSTGIDVDGRREMIKHMIPCIEKAIKRFIAFAKALPGFKDLPIDDQIALIKASRHDTWHIWHNKAFNLEEKIMTSPWGTTYHFETFQQCMGSAGTLEVKEKVIRNLQHLDLNYETTVLLGCISILSADRCNLQEPEKVEEAQWVLMEALTYLLKKNHPEEKHLLAKCIMVLTDLRTVSALHAKEEEKFTMDWSNIIDFPPLFYEIWST